MPPYLNVNITYLEPLSFLAHNHSVPSCPREMALHMQICEIDISF